LAEYVLPNQSDVVEHRDKIPVGQIGVNPDVTPPLIESSRPSPGQLQPMPTDTSWDGFGPLSQGHAVVEWTPALASLVGA
jgi:hypothetical protein